MIDSSISSGPKSSIIMVVEDEALLRFVTCEYFREAGFTVVEAATADEALSYLRSRPEISVVFSDVKMPGSIDGVALVRAVKAEFPTIAVVLASAHMLPSDLRLPVPFFLKPYDFDQVVTKISALVYSEPPEHEI